jgi:hypothetical protein
VSPDPWVITVNGADTHYGWDGYDSMLLPVPPFWYATPDTLLATVAGRDLRLLSDAGAKMVGEKLHHADWVLTDDPEQVTAIGMTHDCDRCRDGTARALAWLAENPGGKIAAGLLYWSAAPNRAAPDTDK